MVSGPTTLRFPLPERTVNIAGVILCGGRSSRMGSPKAFLTLGGKTFLERALESVGDVCRPLAVVAARDQVLPVIDLPDVLILRDSVDDQGPMAGLLAALDQFAPLSGGIWLSSCDVPLLKPAVVRRICESPGDFDAVIPRVNGRLQPLTAIYSTRIHANVRETFEQGSRRLGDLLSRLRVRELTEGDFADIDPTGESFRNVNTSEEYRQLMSDFQERLAGGTTGRP